MILQVSNESKTKSTLLMILDWKSQKNQIKVKPRVKFSSNKSERKVNYLIEINFDFESHYWTNINSWKFFENEFNQEIYLNHISI